MRITMRTNKALLDRFDYLNDLIGDEQRRTNLLTTACQITIDKLKRNRDIFTQAQKLKVKSYKRGSMPENIKIDIDDELYGQVREEVKEYFHLEKVQNPFVCKLALSVYIMSLEGSIRERTGVSNVNDEDVDFPEMVKILMQMMFLDKDCIGLKKIREIIIDWRNNR